MNKEIIEEALIATHSLLTNELEAIEFDSLKNEYLAVIGKIENALKEISEDE